MQCPAQVYTPSSRPYEGIPEPHYPFHDKTVVVTNCGRLCLYREKTVMDPEIDTKRAEKNWEHFCGQNGRTEGCADENVQQGVQARSSTQDENVRDHLQFGSRAGRGTEVSLQVERTVAHRGRGSTGSEAGAA